MNSRKLLQLYVRTFGITALAAAGVSILASHLIYNATNSMPLGLYWLAPAPSPGRGAVVAFSVPPNVQDLVHERRYLPENALLLKPVVALAGDDVCTRDGILKVNGASLGQVLERDSAARALPQSDFCGALPDGEIFVASAHPQSFDSRTFGSIPVVAVRGVVKALWTF
jgi:conjugative transfer signal peptidase TraF